MNVLLHRCLYDGLRRNVPAQVQHLVAVVSQHRADDVLADVVDVAVDRGDDETAFFHRSTALLGNGGANDLKHGLGRLGGAQELGQESLTLFVPLTHQIQGGNEPVLHKGQFILILQSSFRQGGGVCLEPPDDGVLQGYASAGGGNGDNRRFFGKAGNVGLALGVFAGEDPESRYRVHHGLLIGIDDGQSQAREHGLGQETLRNQGTVGQAEGDIGHAQHRL